ncbi:4Fe-4S binding protein [Thermodesulfobacteriota bacterium]
MPEIKAHDEKCSGCGTCELWCSLTYHDSFNPLMANIHFEFIPGKGFKIIFTEDCTQCETCVEHCPYGALTVE